MLTFVSGFGRCGSSLVMQMLNVAGLRCPGRYPAFEVDDTPAAARSGEFDAVKWLDPEPVDGRAPAGCRFIWIDRNPDAQGESMSKFMTAAGERRRAMTPAEYAAVMRRYRDESVAFLASMGAVCVLRFEDLLVNPVEAARTLASLVGQGDPEKMAAVVFARGPECLPGLLEEELARRNR